MNYKASDDRYQTMQYNRCGNSGLKLPLVSLGFWHNFGDTGIYENVPAKIERKEGQDMKQGKIRQMITSIVGALLCGVQIMGCYPLVPAYFAALYLEEVKGIWLVGVMYIGMLYFMPLTAAVKYAGHPSFAQRTSLIITAITRTATAYFTAAVSGIK